MQFSISPADIITLPPSCLLPAEAVLLSVKDRTSAPSPFMTSVRSPAVTLLIVTSLGSPVSPRIVTPAGTVIAVVIVYVPSATVIVPPEDALPTAARSSSTVVTLASASAVAALSATRTEAKRLNMTSSFRLREHDPDFGMNYTALTARRPPHHSGGGSRYLRNML